jgi:hypothetical protein
MIIPDFKVNMLIDLAIDVLIKYPNIIHVVLTQWHVTRINPAGFFFFFLPEFPHSRILLKFFSQILIVDVSP